MNHMTKTFIKAGFLLSFFFALALVPAGVKAAGFTIEWDANTESDLSGYRLFRGGSSLLAMTTTQAMSSGSVLKTVQPSTTTASLVNGLASYTSYYFRLTAYDTSTNQSLFNVNGSNQAAEVVVFFDKNQASDINGDGVVNVQDLSMFLTRFNGTDPIANLDPDSVRSPNVDVTDLSVLLTNFNRTF